MLNSVVFVLSAFLLAAFAQDCATPPKVAPRECCPGYMPSGMTDALLTECGLTPDNSPAKPPACDVTLCILKKTGILTPDNKIIDKATFISTLEPQYPADFKPLLGSVYDACIPQESKSPCGQQAFIFCVKGYLLKNCPASVAVNSPDCMATKAFFEKCVLKM